jgi:hypothetical protein
MSWCFVLSLPTVSMSCITKERNATKRRCSSANRHQKWRSRGTKKRRRRKTHQPLSGRARTHAGWEVRGGRLGDEGTGLTQAIQSIALTYRHDSIKFPVELLVLHVIIFYIFEVFEVSPTAQSSSTPCTLP